MSRGRGSLVVVVGSRALADALLDGLDAHVVTVETPRGDYVGHALDLLAGAASNARIAFEELARAAHESRPKRGPLPHRKYPVRR